MSADEHRRDHHRSPPLVAGIGDIEDELFTLHDAGKAIWDQLDGQRGLAGVVAALVPEFAEAEDGAGERDLLGLVAELLARRLLVAARDGARPGRRHQAAEAAR